MDALTDDFLPPRELDGVTPSAAYADFGLPKLQEIYRWFDVVVIGGEVYFRGERLEDLPQADVIVSP